MQRAQAPSGRDLASGVACDRIEPGPPPERALEDESLDVWGFRDTAFRILENGSVVLTGRRYALCGAELPGLLPWTRETFGIELPQDDLHPSRYPPPVPEPRENRGFLEELHKFLPEDAITNEARVRLRHGHGHTQDEMYAIKYGALGRVPDAVVYPSREEDVAALVEAAARHDVCLIPYGGGTNVTEALRCPADEERMIVSVDVGRLDRILWIDPTNHMACIQAGAVGRLLAEQLAAHGFTLGHEPDSIEFSTLGGWIATHASGMKKNRYGNIEDLVLDVTVVTPKGELSRTAVAPRESVGSDVRRWIFGSEGNLGIVTRAVVKIFPLPEVQHYDAVLFRDFAAGVGFMYELTRAGAVPASVRLVDNLQFQLSQTLKPKAEGLRALLRRVEKLYVTGLRGFEVDRMVACTLVYEGTRSEVEAQERAVRRIARRHGGMRAGAENGQRGYQLTFGIAYIRDFVMKHHILGESFETSVSWSGLIPLCECVKRRLHEEYRRRNLPGNPFVTCRVTQVYESGACVYSLSHHHGVGKLRQAFLPRIMSSASLEWAGEVKRAVDPRNVFGGGNQGLG
jgi:alkyldihydroxyacetonephosphate synthase